MKIIKERIFFVVVILLTLILSVDPLAYGEISSFTSDKNRYSMDEQLIFSGLSEANKPSISIIVLNPLGELETFVSESSNDGNFEFIFNPADIFSMNGIHKITAHVTDEPAYEGIALLFDFDGSFINNLTAEIKSKNSGRSTQELPPNCKVIKTGEISAVFCDDKENDEQVEKTDSIPRWVKQTALWWHQGNSSDKEFISSISFLMSENIINNPILSPTETIKEDKVPKWVKNIAGWWAENKISEKEFVNAVNHLIEKRIIQIK